ncbi:MAG: YwbE family protein [Acidobacteriota bacterium]
MPHRERKNIRPGMKVAIVLKQDQRNGRETVGVVKDLLTNSSTHPHGIKVRLADGQIGRVQKILSGAGDNTL